MGDDSTFYQYIFTGKIDKWYEPFRMMSNIIVQMPKGQYPPNILQK